MSDWTEWEYKPVTAEEESKLITKAKGGCSDSMNRLFEAHMPWWVRCCVNFLESRYFNKPVSHQNQKTYEIDDLLSICFLHLQKSLSGFDETQGNRLLTYVGAFTWQWFARSEGRDFKNITTVDDDYLKDQIVVKDHVDQVVRNLAQEQYRQVIQEALETIPIERDREIIQIRFLQEFPPTLQEIGIELGISRERVRQIEERGRHHIRKYIQDHHRWVIDDIQGENYE